MPTESIGHAVERLTAAGFVDDFRAEADGLRAQQRGVLCRPEDLDVHEVVRIDSATDPADQAVVFALTCRLTGVRGTYAAPYGPSAADEDQRMLRRLKGPTHDRA